MDAFGIIGMTFGIIALGLATKLKQEVEALKKALIDAGVLKENDLQG
jgi:hypothetical protein